MLADFFRFGDFLVAIVAAAGQFAAGRLEVRLPRGFGAYRKPGNQLLQVRALARRTRGHRLLQYQRLELFAALAAFVLVNRHLPAKKSYQKLTASENPALLQTGVRADRS
jgi:hypothetical protein